MERTTILTTAQAFDYYKDTNNLRNPLTVVDDIVKVFTYDSMVANRAIKKNRLDWPKIQRLEKHYYDNGYTQTFKFILESKVEQYLKPTEDISKIIELLSLTTREKSIVQYLNYLEDKKRTILPLYSNIIINTYDSTNVVKLSQRQLKYMKAKVNNLTLNELAFYESFVGVVELDTDGHSLARAKVKARKIKALYTARVPHCNIDFAKVIAALHSMGIESSEQDVIAFLSLIVELSHDGISVNIPASFWGSMFGRIHIKEAKQVFEDLGILSLVSKALPGFKSAGYKINFCDELYDNEERPSIATEITSINTLEKLNRITRHKGNFTLNEKIEALELMTNLRSKENKITGRINFTRIFIESGRLGKLIIDLEKMQALMNDNSSYAIALPLAIHLTAYFDNIKKGLVDDYRTFYYKETNEKPIQNNRPLL